MESESDEILNIDLNTTPWHQNFDLEPLLQYEDARIHEEREISNIESEGIEEVMYSECILNRLLIYLD